MGGFSGDDCDNVDDKTVTVCAEGVRVNEISLDKLVLDYVAQSNRRVRRLRSPARSVDGQLSYLVEAAEAQQAAIDKLLRVQKKNAELKATVQKVRQIIEAV